MNGKICTKCKTRKEFSQFHVKRDKKDGYRSECKECHREQQRNRYESNKDKILARQRTYKRERSKTDPMFRLRANMRKRVWEAITVEGYTKRSRTHDIIGCSWEALKEHLESQFDPEMTWENYGDVWSVDHRIPLASAKNKKELLELCRYDNLQPLWTKDNIRKGDKLPHEWAAINS